MDWIGLDWTEWIGSDWTGLNDWIGLDFSRLDWIELDYYTAQKQHKLENHFLVGLRGKIDAKCRIYIILSLRTY